MVKIGEWVTDNIDKNNHFAAEKMYATPTPYKVYGAGVIKDEFNVPIANSRIQLLWYERNTC